MAIDHLGNFWVGSYKGGLDLFDPETETFKNYKNDPNDSTSLPADDIRDIMEDSKGNLWIACNGGGLAKFNRAKENFSYFNKGNTEGNLIATNWLVSLYEDSRGLIWAGGYGGLSILNPNTGTFTSFWDSKNQGKQALIHSWIFSITEDKNGNIWVGTGGGIILIHAKYLANAPQKDLVKTDIEFEFITKENGLPNNVINAIVEDEKGQMWITSNKGLTKYNYETKQVFNYNINDGLLGEDFSQGASFKTKEGKLFFGATIGSFSFMPNDLQENNYIPPIHLDEFNLFNKTIHPSNEKGSILKKDISVTKELILNYDQNVLNFKFSALNFLAPKQNSYAYMMVNFDQDWRYAGNQRSATYTNLNPGEYILKIKGANNDNIWNEEGYALKIIVTPPFWKTWWFKTLAFLMITTAFISWYKWRVNALKARQVELEKTVEERTFEIRQSKEQVEQQNLVISESHKELEQRQEEIEALASNLQTVNLKISEQNQRFKDSISYAKTIQKAILPKDKMLSKIFDDHFVLYKAKDIVSGDFYWSSQQGNLRFLAVVDCTGHGVPGAFMSIIGSTLLNRIVNEYKISDPSQILHLLHEEVQLMLHQHEAENSDGMDMSLCVFETLANGDTKMIFCGAKNSIYIKKPQPEAELELIKADNISIGGIWRKDKTFTSQEIILEKGTIVYQFSDGYQDQNDIDRKKIGKKTMLTLLNEIAARPLDAQLLSLDQFLENHQAGTEQRDDITVMGVRM